MMYSYVSNYSNQVHQLVVSISNHLYVLKNGIIKYQDKKLDVNLKNFSKSSKLHIIHYLIKDHFSGLFYAESHSSDQPPSIDRFLYNAWKRKNEYQFCGIPESIMIPKNVIGYYPKIMNIFKNSPINYIETTSGFQSGAPSLIKTWEKELLLPISMTSLSLSELNENIERFNREINLSKIEKWKERLPNIEEMQDEKTFLSIFT